MGKFFAIFLVFLGLLYTLAYLAHPALPGNNLQYPLGWWGWFDQGKYLLSSQSFILGNFSIDKHLYPPLYPRV